MRARTDGVPTDEARRLWFFESLDQIHRALRRGRDHDDAMLAAFDEVLDVLACDRVWLSYPCVPGATSVRIVMARSRPGWTGALTAGVDVPAGELDEIHRMLLGQDLPISFGVGAMHPLPPSATAFGVRAAAAMAIDPRVDSPYVFGIHRCELDRAWSDDELRLFQAVGRRIGDALGTTLVMRSLQASERQYRAVVDHATDALFVHGDQGRIIDVNQQACESLGYTRDELLGMSPTEFDPDVTPEFLAALGPKIRAGGTVAFDSRHRRKDGTLFPVEVRLRSFVLGERTLAVALARDISERKRAEQALRASEERFRELAETIAEVFWVTNAEKSAMLYISPAYERIWGRTCQSLYDAPQSWLDAIHPDDRARVLDAALTKQEAGLYDEEYRIVRPDGEARWIRDVAFPVRDATGRVARVVGVARDITDRRSLEMQLRHSQKMDAIGQLAGGVAHDFNNLLGAILLDADHADGMPHHPDEVREAVADIRAAAERAAALTRQLLLFGRRQALQARSLDLNAIVRDLTKMLQRIIGEDIRLDVRLSAMQLAVHADAGMLEQVLVNLVVNARDAMPNGGTLTIATTEQIFDGLGASRVLDAQPGRYACLTVTDTGAGIAPEILPRIFEPFFTTKEPGRGTGLGLATAFGIVKEHRGWIAVDSATGRGTTFEVFVPIQGDASDTRARAVTTSPGGSETIFFVEDEPQLRRATRRILERHGYRVIEADNGADAMRMWPDIRQAVSLLLTDVVMPGGIDGFELASRLRADRPELAVIFASGYPPDAQQPERPLQKPVPSAQLLETIRRSLDRRV